MNSHLHNDKVEDKQKISPCTTFQSCGIYYRDLKIQGRRRQRKHCWKSELVFFQSSSWLLQVTNFVKSRSTALKLNPKNHIQILKQEGNFLSGLCTSSVQREIRHFHVVVVKWRQRNVQKSMMHMWNCCFGYYAPINVNPVAGGSAGKGWGFDKF